MARKLSSSIKSHDEIVQSLLPEHQALLLSVVLTWGSLDGAMGMLVSGVRRYHPVDGAEYVKGMGTTDRFRDVIHALGATPGAEAAAKKFRRYKKVYERYSKTRNFIAHSHCAGYVRDDPTRIVFLPYERVGDGLAVDVVPTEQMRRAITWGVEMKKLAMDVFDEANKIPLSNMPAT